MSQRPSAKAALLRILAGGLVLLAILTLFRVALFFAYAPTALKGYGWSDLFPVFLFGLRMDLSVTGYLLLPALLIFGTFLFWRRFEGERFQKLLYRYFFAASVLLSAILAADFAYFSYFGEHITLWIFGIVDDDTKALLKIALKNYNLPLLAGLAALYLLGLRWLLRRLPLAPMKTATRDFSAFPQKAGLLLGLLLLDFLAIRGSFGAYPVYRWPEDVSADPFLNRLSKSAVYEAYNAVRQYRKSRNGRRDYVRQMGFSGKIAKAFSIVTGKESVDPGHPLASLRYVTPSNPAARAIRPHVVVIMVESFGMPILKYQSDDFDIMRSLKKHFDEDILFTRFISAANGTIVSMEPTLLNLTALPGAVPFGQSRYQTHTFTTAAAKVYRNAGYETTFLYGGDLSWRNVGNFFARQGFAHTEGKAKIAKTLNLPAAAFHDWGVYDQFLYRYIVEKLRHASSPQFIFAMTTNNHPPYELYEGYRAKPLKISEALRRHFRGDMGLIEKRLYDYQYALDMAGRFLDAIKGSELARNTVVAITADNNTIEGIMNYDDFVNESKRIPFYVYLPPKLRPDGIDTTVPGSHKDLMATLFDLTLDETSYMTVGKSLLRPGLHCGLNVAGIVLSEEGAFMAGKPRNPVQRRCDLYRRAAIAVTDYVVRHATTPYRPEKETQR